MGEVNRVEKGSVFFQEVLRDVPGKMQRQEYVTKIPVQFGQNGQSGPLAVLVVVEVQDSR